LDIRKNSFPERVSSIPVCVRETEVGLRIEKFNSLIGLPAQFTVINSLRSPFANWKK